MSDAERDLARHWYRMHVALIQEGFTVDQAFDLTKMFVESSLFSCDHEDSE